MGFFSKLKEGLTKTRKSLTEKIEKVIIGYADIDDDLWNGKAVSAKTPVTLIGEVDIDHKPAKRIEIDVDQVRF